MSYSHRFGGKRWRHDPAATGIFIHGGTCCAGPFYPTSKEPNRFGITLPTKNRKGQDISYSAEIETSTRKPTFLTALAHVRQLQSKHPVLADCPVYACTDLHMENRSSGKIKVQLV